MRRNNFDVLINKDAERVSFFLSCCPKDIAFLCL
jgi:hypothetical protein